jgi:hypothetical protein
MRLLLALFAALLTLCLGVVLLRALLSAALGAGGFGLVVGGATVKLLWLPAALLALFVVLLVVYRRRQRRKLT